MSDELHERVAACALPGHDQECAQAILNQALAARPLDEIQVDHLLAIGYRAGRSSIQDEAEQRGYAKAVADLRREGICGDEMPRAFPGMPDGVCELTYNHASLWHEMPNANGSPCRWRVIADDATAGQTPGGTDGRPSK